MTRLLEPGERIADWLILDRLMGAWGVVYVVRQLNFDENLPRPAVLVAKTLRPEWSSDSHYVKLFEQEAYTWLSLGVYKHIVRLFFVDRFSDQVFAFGEYVPGILLPNTLRRWIDSNIIELESALYFGVQICRALAYSRSRGVLIHQDLKPENIMVNSDGVIKVTDWGLSHMKPAPISGISSTGSVPYLPRLLTSSHESFAYGTPGYAAPELSIVGSEPSPQADMFSLGAILVEMISGELPGADMKSTELVRLLAPLSPAVRTETVGAISACLSSSPTDRPDSTDLVEKVLKAAFEELVGVPMEEGPVPNWETQADLGQRAYALFMLGRLDEAMMIQSQITRAIADDAETDSSQPEAPKLPVVMMDYKEHGFKFVVPIELVEQAEKKLESNPDSVEALQHAILLNEIGGYADRALELSQLWLKREPNNLDALKKISEIFAQQEKWKEALIYLDRALESTPDDVENWMKKSKYLGQSGDSQEALLAAKKAAEFGPADEPAHSMYGHLLAESGDLNAALAEFQEAARLNPESAPALYNIGTSWNTLGRSDLAFQYLEQAVEKDPDFAIAWNTLGGLSMQAYTFQEALIYFERAIEADSHYAQPWFNKGQALEMLEKFEEARAAYLTAIQLNPDYKLAKDALERLELEHFI